MPGSLRQWRSSTPVGCGRAPCSDISILRERRPRSEYQKLFESGTDRFELVSRPGNAIPQPGTGWFSFIARWSITGAATRDCARKIARRISNRFEPILQRAELDGHPGFHARRRFVHFFRSCRGRNSFLQLEIDPASHLFAAASRKRCQARCSGLVDRCCVHPGSIQPKKAGIHTIGLKLAPSEVRIRSVFALLPSAR